ncbi:MAG: hypothetical protein SVM79_07240 [Chloroflexota bacterium]|nr:hypothetical protein [Chloroflexota bacterium]
MRIKSQRRPLFNVMATTISWALMSLLLAIFYAACFNPSHQIIIDVNAYGEMLIEAVLFAFIWVMTTKNMIDDLGSTLK